MVDMLRVRAVTSGWIGGPGLWQWYFDTVDQQTPTTAEATEASARVRAAVFLLAPLFPASWSCQVDPSVTIMTPGSGEVQDVLTADSPDVVDGTGSEDYGPTVLAAVARWRTGVFVAGHHVQGRTFIGPTQIHDTVTGQPDGTLIDTVEDFQAALADSGTENVQLGVWHRPKAGSGGALYPVSSFLCSPKFGILRSHRD